MYEQFQNIMKIFLVSLPSKGRWYIPSTVVRKNATSDELSTDPRAKFTAFRADAAQVRLNQQSAAAVFTSPPARPFAPPTTATSKKLFPRRRRRKSPRTNPKAPRGDITTTRVGVSSSVG